MRCAFRNNGCKSCEECNAEPNMVNEKCERCFECENKEGRLRWGDNENKGENKIAQINKPEIHEIMVIAR